ncbi:hypothetical protein C8R46DRAFT_1138384 [Mycena filopes]|nr:hypothetical protein C8R46DRAFT_1138384 [Mycena filopes]
MTRKLHVEKMALLAKEQGRKRGYETRFGHGRVIAVTRERRRNELGDSRCHRCRRSPAPRLSRNTSRAMGGGTSFAECSERRQRRVSSHSTSIMTPRPPAPAAPPSPVVNNAQPAILPSPPAHGAAVPLLSSYSNSNKLHPLARLRRPRSRRIQTTMLLLSIGAPRRSAPGGTALPVDSPCILAPPRAPLPLLLLHYCCYFTSESRVNADL